MSATHAVLGLLLNKPTYPYELGNQLERRLGPSWAVNTGQLSQIIKRLEKEGLIERVGGATGARDDRRIFAITEAGIQEFERWFSTSAPRGARLPRRPLLVKVSLAGPQRLTEALQQIDSYEDECTTELARLTSEQAKIVDGPIVRADDEFLRLALAENIIEKEGQLEWTKLARERVSWLLEQNAIWPSTRGRAGAANDEARGAREELFRDMAAERHERPKPGKRGRDSAA
ncbi:MAG TPA: helix-turn-helix transcriptional regulator [Solirubrobacteraceae bacterium]|jgi:DNA-binding PadR family transcriptional regulator|nr:helix-turn-helix transcriptional regulator [Solirubrobacteraceae bacterium]